MSSTKKAEKTLEYILDIISDGVWDWNVLTGHVERNAGWYRMLGYPKQSFHDDVLTWENVIHPDDYPRVMSHFEDYINGKVAEYRIQYRCMRKDGGTLWIEDSGRIVEWTEDGKPARMIGAHTDIDKLKKAEQGLEQKTKILRGEYQNLEQIIQERTQELAKLNKRLEDKVAEVERIASRDSLTGLYNRRMFEQLIDIEIKRAQRYSQPLSVILADIDNFKAVNDQYGHREGDNVITRVADILKDLIRGSDLLARWGGEEFAIILPNTSQDIAFDMAERLRQSVADSESVSECTRVTCSFGVTQYNLSDSFDSLFFRMDKALYQAKNNNRNNVQLI